MFIDVETFLLNAGIHSEAVQFLDAIEEDESTGGCPEVDDYDAEALCAEEGEAVSVENALRNTEETSQDGAEDTAYTVNGACTYRVVDVELLVNKLGSSIIGLIEKLASVSEPQRLAS